MSKAETIMKSVCQKYGVMPNEVRGRSRSKNLVDARSEFARLGRIQGWSSTMIGRMLCRDHTTILNYYKKHKEEK